jgi:predicted unusual protein kinase regulating ubiquinone biosynthesis (AarF/ABC1/UbiB family)
MKLSKIDMYPLQSKNIHKTLESTKKLGKVVKFAASFHYLQNVKKVSAKELGVFTRENLALMGATFIKIGQLLSSRTDIIDKDIANELAVLQDNVPPFDISIYKDELANKSIVIDEIPLASASIGQVHKGVLTTGEVVAVKLKRPGIENEIQTDFQVLLGFLAFLRRYSTKRELYELETIFKQYNTLLYEEINYENELTNMISFKELFGGTDTMRWLKVPTTYKELSSNDVIVMEYVPTIKINDLQSLNDMKFNKSKIAAKLVECFIKQIVEYGQVHIDPHPGNVGITKMGKIVFYDYGMVTKINDVLISKFQDLLYAVSEKDCDKVASILVEAEIVSVEPENIIYLKSFVLSLFNYVEKVDIAYFKENFIDKLNSTELPFLINSSFLLILRGLTILEGVCKNLDPDFNYIDVINDYNKSFPLDINYFEIRALRDIENLQQLRVPYAIDKSKKNEIDADLLEKRLKDLSVTKKQLEQKQTYFNIIVIFLLCLLGIEGEVLQHNIFMPIGLAGISFLSINNK